MESDVFLVIIHKRTSKYIFNVCLLMAQIGSFLKIPPDKVPVHYTEEYWKLIFHNAEITKQQRHPLRGISLSSP